MSLILPRPSLHLTAVLALVMLSVAGCTQTVPTTGPREFALVPCSLDVPGAPTAPPGYTMVAPGTIVFTQDAWHNASGSSTACGAQAVRGATSVIEFSSLDGEDTIFWVATLARHGQPMTPEPVLPTMTLSRLDLSGQIVVETQIDELGAYNMRGNYGHDAQPGSYIMRIVAASGDLLAEGRFEIVE